MAETNRKTLEEWKELYDKEGKRPRKNQLTLDEIENYLISINDTEWFYEEYMRRVHIVDGKPLPLSKKDLDEMRVLFLDKHFPKIEFTTAKELTEKEKRELDRLKRAQKASKK
jgi:hypothetical protein